jgi:hypothetical protein
MDAVLELAHKNILKDFWNILRKLQNLNIDIIYKKIEIKFYKWELLQCLRYVIYIYIYIYMYVYIYVYIYIWT